MYILLVKYLPFLFILVYGYAVGLSVNRVAQFLDGAMTYKNILWKVRFYAVLWSTKKRAKFVTQFNKDIRESNVEDLPDNVHITYKEYTGMLGRGFLCSDCFGFWILCLVSPLCYYLMGTDWNYYILFLLFNMAGKERK